MFGLLGVELSPDAPIIVRQVAIDSFDQESLMVDWLSELIYLHETSHMICYLCSVTAWSPTHLEAAVSMGQPAILPTSHIKAVTYHQLIVRQEEDSWIGQVYFDV